MGVVIPWSRLQSVVGAAQIMTLFALAKLFQTWHRFGLMGSVRLGSDELHEIGLNQGGWNGKLLI